MIDSPELKKSKDRSPTFPFITLERALERAREFYDEEKRGIAPYTRAVLHWKYSEASSGGLQTVAAMKNYGLMSEPLVPGAKVRHVQLTDLALRILLDQRPDSHEREGFLREAASKPAVAAEVYSKWPSLPSPATLNHFLMLEKKFTEETASKVGKILKENQQFAGISEGTIESDRQDYDGDAMNESAPTGARVPKADTGHFSLTMAPTPAAVASSWKFLMNDKFIEVVGRLDNSEEVDRLIRVLETTKALLPTKAPNGPTPAQEVTDKAQGSS